MFCVLPSKICEARAKIYPTVYKSGKCRTKNIRRREVCKRRLHSFQKLMIRTIRTRIPQTAVSNLTGKLYFDAIMRSLFPKMKTVCCKFTMCVRENFIMTKRQFWMPEVICFCSDNLSKDRYESEQTSRNGDV